MEIWKYIEVLKQSSNSWFFTKDHTKEKLEALDKIALEGYPSLIYGLTDFLSDKNEQVRLKTCATIIHLFNKIDSKKGFYGSLKHCRVSTNHIDIYSQNFPTDSFVELLAICSLNGNGYVREKAVKKLSHISRSRAIQFLIYRLADWVPQVRHAAIKGIENYKSVQYLDSLIENMPLFEWLQKVERTNLGGVYHGIIEFIISTNREYVLINFINYHDKLRLVLAKHLSNSLNSRSQELNLFLSDNHFLIRNLVFDHFELLEKDEIDHLLCDKSAMVRRQALERLKGTVDFEITAKRFLTDPSSTIRFFARYTLRNENVNFESFYVQCLQNEVQVIGSMAGLAELGATQCSEMVFDHLKNEKLRIKKAAFLALRTLDEKNAYAFALANLDSPFIGLRNVIIDFLSQIPSQKVLTEARHIYKTGSLEMKKSMLKLFSKIGGWLTIPDIMLATIDENHFIRGLGKQYVETWKIRATNLFSRQKDEDRKRGKQIFKLAFEVHKEKGYFSTNPLDGMDFYFD